MIIQAYPEPDMFAPSQYRFDLTIPGDPVPKARPRVLNGHGVTPVQTRSREDYIRNLFTQEYPGVKPLECPVEITMRFYMPDHRTRDFDNLAKLVTDALNGLAYKDDRYITTAIIYKILPSIHVPGVKGVRKRHQGDPLTDRCGNPYEPHTQVRIMADYLEEDIPLIIPEQ